MAEEIVMEIKRGYVKWTDKDGVPHKELLSDHPELLAEATPMQQLAAEEARRMGAAGEEEVDTDEEEAEQVVLDTLDMLKAAPDDILTGPAAVEAVSAAEADAEPVEGTKPASGAEEPAAKPTNTKPADSRPLVEDEHSQALEELRSRTS